MEWLKPVPLTNSSYFGTIQLLDICQVFESLIHSNRDRSVPGQWLISKIIQFTKSDKKCVENLRPVANLCSVSKIFEKLILKRINELKSLNGIFLGGKQQHGFVKKQENSYGRSTFTVVD